MRNIVKAIAVGVIALMVGGGSVSAASNTSNSNKQKIAKIKKENKNTINKAKKKLVKKNNQAKAVKNNNAALKKLNAQKRAEIKKIKTLTKATAHKDRNVRVAVPNSNYPKKHTVKNTIVRTENLPSKLVNPKVASNPHLDAKAYYVYQKSNQDKSARINGKLTAAQQKEMADFTVTLLNSYLKANGKAPVKWSSQMQNQMNVLINKRQNAKYGTSSTRMDLAKQVFPTNKGLAYQNELVDGMVAPSKTMLQLKVSVLNSLTQMFYVSDPYQYAIPLMAQAGRQVGVSIQKNTGFDANYRPYIMIIGMAKDTGKVKLTNQKTSFASTYRKTVASNNDIKKLQVSKKKLAKLNKQIKVKNASLNKVMKKKFKQNTAEFNKTKKAANQKMNKKLRQL